MKKAFMAVILIVRICASADAAWHYWRCRFCGRGVTADNCPPAGKCDKSPWGTHDWEMQR